MSRLPFLPSLFTLASLFLGFLAIIQIFKGNFINAVYLMTGSVVLDGFDGTVARLTKTESNFGVQLDSLVDGVAFGTVTGVLIYNWGFQAGIAEVGAMLPQLGKVIGFIFLSAGIIRLARFNVMKEVETQPSNVFTGLPIPSGALAIVAVVLLFQTPPKETLHIAAFSLYVVIVSILMISNVKYRTMKKIRTKNSLILLFCLAIIIALAIPFFRYTIPAIALLYLLSPILFFFIELPKKKNEKLRGTDANHSPADSHSHSKKESGNEQAK